MPTPTRLQTDTAPAGLPLLSGDELGDKVCLVTGATAGIGQATAAALVARGAGVILLARDKQKGEATAAALLEQYPGARLHLLVADMSSLESVRRAAKELKENMDGLHVLLNVAGVFVRKRVVTEEGFELMFATNYLGPFLLTNLLIGLLLEGAPARIVNVAAPSTVRPDLDDLQGEKRFASTRAFGASKAGDLLFTFALARRLEGTGITVNAFHPGIVRTGLMREAALPMRLLSGTLSLLRGRPPEAAGRELADLALSAGYDDISGRLIHRTQPVRAPFEDDLELQERLWEISERLAGLSGPGG